MFSWGWGIKILKTVFHLSGEIFTRGAQHPHLPLAQPELHEYMTLNQCVLRCPPGCDQGRMCYQRTLGNPAWDGMDLPKCLLARAVFWRDEQQSRLALGCRGLVSRGDTVPGPVTTSALLHRDHNNSPARWEHWQLGPCSFSLLLLN